jgi:hypothetical protein
MDLLSVPLKGKVHYLCWNGEHKAFFFEPSEKRATPIDAINTIADQLFSMDTYVAFTQYEGGKQRDNWRTYFYAAAAYIGQNGKSEDKIMRGRIERMKHLLKAAFHTYIPLRDYNKFRVLADICSGESEELFESTLENLPSGVQGARDRRYIAEILLQKENMERLGTLIVKGVEAEIIKYLFRAAILLRRVHLVNKLLPLFMDHYCLDISYLQLASRHSSQEVYNCIRPFVKMGD